MVIESLYEFELLILWGFKLFFPVLKQSNLFGIIQLQSGKFLLLCIQDKAKFVLVLDEWLMADLSHDLFVGLKRRFYVDGLIFEQFNFG